jgi:predicted acyltransferase
MLNYFNFQADLANLCIMEILQRIALAAEQDKEFLYFLGDLDLYCRGLAVFNNGLPYSMEGNLVWLIDLAIIGDSNMWHNGKIAFDHEYLLSTFPALVTVLFVYLTGSYIHSQPNLKQTVLQLTPTGIAAIITWLVWGLVFPINKYLLTSSFFI